MPGFKSPFEHSGIIQPIANLRGQIVVAHAKEIHAAFVEARPHVCMQILAEFARVEEADFVEHPGEVKNAGRFLVGRLGDFGRVHARNLSTPARPFARFFKRRRWHSRQ